MRLSTIYLFASFVKKLCEKGFYVAIHFGQKRKHDNIVFQQRINVLKIQITFYAILMILSLFI